MTTPIRTAVIAGSNGLVGSCVLAQLCASTHYQRLVLPTRRAPSLNDPRIKLRAARFDMLDDVLADVSGPALDVYCCLGTRIHKAAGSQAAFRAVDFDAVVALAEWARRAGARRFLLLSAMGADARSWIFYNRVRGETEDAVCHNGPASVVALRPGLLVSDELRPAERLGLALARPICPLLPASLRPVRVEDVAACMIDAARAEEPPKIIVSAAMHGRANRSSVLQSGDSSRKLPSSAASMSQSSNNIDFSSHVTPERTSFALRLTVVALVVLAVMQWLMPFAGGALWMRVLSIAILLGSVVVAMAPISAIRRLSALIVLGALGFGNLALHAMTSTEAFAMRLLLIATLMGYASLALVGLTALVSRRSAADMMILALVTTAGLTAIEAVIEHTSPANVVRWEGGTQPHPVLEESYPPNTVARTIYQSDPRNYFNKSDPRTQQWRLESNHAGSAARLLFPDSPGFDGVRVEIDRAEVPTPWHIQLSGKGLSVEKGERYTLSFKVRADQPRPFSYGVSQAHPPWDNLGWYRNIDIGTDWIDIVGTFRAKASDDLARLTFDLGAHPSSVEIRNLRVQSFDSKLSVMREPTPEFSVSYRFNDRGCRGPNHAVPKPPNVRRILVLGDSYVLGVGVHEEDTFTSRLEAILAADPSTPAGVRHEVINCGVSGYSTLQERQSFEILGPVYQPDIVIVGMVLNDDSSWRSDVANGYFHVPGRLEQLSLIMRAFQTARHEGRKPRSDFSSSLKEVLTLQKLTEELGAKLVVFSFRNHPLKNSPWEILASTMSKGLAGTGVPWLDVGDRIVDEETWKSLLVHPDGDWHPNEIVHQSAAEQVAQLLRDHGFLH